MGSNFTITEKTALPNCEDQSETGCCSLRVTDPITLVQCFEGALLSSLTSVSVQGAELPRNHICKYDEDVVHSS